MSFARPRGLGCCAAVLVAACSGSENPAGGGSGAGGHAVSAGQSGRAPGGSGSAQAGAVTGSGGVGGSGGANNAGGKPSVTAGSSGRAGVAGQGHAGALAAGGATGNAGASGAANGRSGRGGANSALGGAGDDAGAGGLGGDGPGSDEIPAGYVKAVIGVGYGGIRIVSRDAGNTWGDRAYAAPNGGDDDDLLRAVVYGKGRWLASGWKLMTSDDGLHWTDHGKFHDGIITDEQIIEGLAYKDGYFYAAGDGSPSRLYRSADGLTWSHFSTIGDTVKHTGLAYRGGVFVSYGDSNTSYRSSDGSTWTDMGLEQATYCEGKWKSFDDCFQAFWSDDGYYLLPQWGGDITRATSGQNFRTVYSDDQQNTLYRSRAAAEGYVAPN